MRTVAQLQHKHLQAYANIVYKAYPDLDFDRQENREMLKNRLSAIVDNPKTPLYGIFENSTLIGGMIMYHFSMNWFGTMVPVVGVGLVAVDLAHKKKGAALDLIRFFIAQTRRQGSFMASLYSFRPDFYHNMGFGFGPTRYLYSYTPKQLPYSKDADSFELLDHTNAKALATCYNRVLNTTHGMFARDESAWQRLLKNPGQTFVGVRRGRRLSGYMRFGFDKAVNPNQQRNIDVDEMIYETPQALQGLLNFLHIQADQAPKVKLALFEQAFPWLLNNPCHTSNSIFTPIYHNVWQGGIGIMYRLCNCKQAVLTKPWPRLDINVRFSISDNLLPANNHGFILNFSEPKPQPARKADVTLKCSLADFSSLLSGSVSLTQLLQLGLAQTTGANSQQSLLQLFANTPAPRCYTQF